MRIIYIILIIDFILTIKYFDIYKTHISSCFIIEKYIFSNLDFFIEKKIEKNINYS